MLEVKKYLQVVKDEKESLRGEPLVKLYSVGERWWHLVVERRGGAGVPHKILPETRRNKKTHLEMININTVSLT